MTNALSPQKIREILDLIEYKKHFEVRRVHIACGEPSAGTLGYQVWQLPIKNRGQIFFLMNAKFWFPPPADTPAISGADESVRCSIDLAAEHYGAPTVIGDYSMPQNIAMVHRVKGTYNANYSIDTGGGFSTDNATDAQTMNIGSIWKEYHTPELDQDLNVPIPYPKIRISIESTNASVIAWVHCRLTGIVLDLEPDQWGFLTRQYGSYR